MNARSAMARAFVPLLGVVAMLAGLASGLACCPEPQPVVGGTYEVLDDEDALRPDIAGAMVLVHEGGVEISYTLPDGSTWVVDYSRRR